MSSKGPRYRPTLDGLEARQVLSAALAGAGEPRRVSSGRGGLWNGHDAPFRPSPHADPQFTLDQLAAFSRAYLTTSHDALYNPAFDFNQNGFIGQGDGKVLLHQLPPISPKIPLKVRLTRGPRTMGGHVSSNSGGHTSHRQVTILGHTTPGSLIFSDSMRAIIRSPVPSPLPTPGATSRSR